MLQSSKEMKRLNYNKILEQKISILSVPFQIYSISFPGQAGEEITTSYLKPNQATFIRRHLLFEKWRFWCLCNRCADPSELGSNLGGE